MIINELIPQVRECFVREMAALMNKYNRITQYTNEEIQRVFNLLEKMDLLGNGELDIQQLIELVELMKENSIEALEFYVWWNQEMIKDLEEITIQQAQDYIDKIEDEGFIEVENYAIYNKRSSLKQLKHNLLDEMLEYSCQVERLFDATQLAEMWIERATKQEVIADFEDVELDAIVEDIPQEAYTTINGIELMYVELNI